MDDEGSIEPVADEPSPKPKRLARDDGTFPRDERGYFLPRNPPEPEPPVTGAPEALTDIKATPTGLAVPLKPAKRHWAEPGDPWERQVGEQLAPWKAFKIYRDLGEERDLGKVMDDPKVKAGMLCIKNWASQWKWTERAIQFDRMIDRRKVEARARQTALMHERHIKESMALQQVGMKRVENLLKPENAKKLENLAPATALRFVDLGVQIERKARGVDDDRDDEVVVSQITDAVKASLFDKIAQMASNIAAVRQMGGGTVIDATATPVYEEDEAVGE
ncbi:MAG TPA: hypothetical protein VF244_02835 [Acidimicrobiales bacterium]